MSFITPPKALSVSSAIRRQTQFLKRRTGATGILVGTLAGIPGARLYEAARSDLRQLGPRGRLTLATGVLRPSASVVMPRSAGSEAGHADPGRSWTAGRPFRRRWAEKGSPPRPASELAMLRRLSLALCGSVPSLEEIRRFEARPTEGRLRRLARRPARATAASPTTWPSGSPGPWSAPRTVRSSVSPPPVHRLAQRCDPGEPPLRRHRPRADRRAGPLDRSAGDQLRLRHVRPGDRASPTPERLAARVSRRSSACGIDCAQCHDHPVPALEAGRFPRPGGVLRRRLLQPARHSRRREHVPPSGPQDQGAGDVAPRVPFRPELLPALRATLASSSPPG